MKGQLLRGKSIIYSSILKHGLDNFSLSILEYCELECLIKREKYYIELLNPVYNIIKDPTVPPMLGRKHTDVTIEKMKKRLHSKETRTKISTSMKGNSNAKNHPSAQKIEVVDSKENKTTSYYSIKEAGRVLNIPVTSIHRYLDTGNVYKKRYTFASQGPTKK